MTTPDQRIQAAFASDHFKEIAKDLGEAKVVQILAAFMEVDPCSLPNNRVTDIERRRDPIKHGSETTGMHFNDLVRHRTEHRWR